MSYVGPHLLHVHRGTLLPCEAARLEERGGQVQLDREMDEAHVGGEEAKACEPERHEDGARPKLELVRAAEPRKERDAPQAAVEGVVDAKATKGVVDLNSLAQIDVNCATESLTQTKTEIRLTIHTSGSVSASKDQVIKLRAQGRTQAEAWVDALLEGMAKPLVIARS